MPVAAEMPASGKGRPDDVLITALAKAHRWQRMLDAGRHESIADLAVGEKVNAFYCARLLRPNLLAADLTEAILFGRQPKGLQVTDLLRPLPLGWSEQRRVLERATPGCLAL